VNNDPKKRWLNNMLKSEWYINWYDNYQGTDKETNFYPPKRPTPPQRIIAVEDNTADDDFVFKPPAGWKPRFGKK
jgi:hypothetical protein